MFCFVFSGGRGSLLTQNRRRPPLHTQTHLGLFFFFHFVFPAFLPCAFFLILIFSKFKVNKQNQRTTFSSSSSSSFSLCWFCGLPVSKQTHHHLNGWPLGDVVSTSIYHLRPQILFSGISFFNPTKRLKIVFSSFNSFQICPLVTGCCSILWCRIVLTLNDPRYIIVGEVARWCNNNSAVA